MSIYIGNTKIGKMYLGSTEIAQAYLGSTKVYQNSLPYDAEIEYLEATGTQYILTGISGNARIVGSAQATIVKGSSQALICSVPNASGACWLAEALTLQKWGVGTASGMYVDIAPTTAITFDLDFSSTGITGNISGISVSRPQNTTKYEWSIFATSDGSYPFTGKMFYMKFYQGNNLVRDFIPVRVGTTGYLYDKVSGQLFGNAGSGSFTYGNDVTS